LARPQVYAEIAVAKSPFPRFGIQDTIHHQEIAFRLNHNLRPRAGTFRTYSRANAARYSRILQPFPPGPGHANKLTRAGYKQLARESHQWEQATEIMTRFLAPKEN